jgi:hypothetical protein
VWRRRPPGSFGVALFESFKSICDLRIFHTFVCEIRGCLGRGAGLRAQGFALLGTLVGIATIAIGVGPRTVGDITFHLAIVIVLVCDVIVAVRVKRSARTS